MSKIEVIHGDCLEKLKELDDNSIDSIVTDPPYELGFMGKAWDNTGIANSVEMRSECLRVLKPGGHLLAFSGTRTYHRMAVAIEDAGFEVRDMIEWVYGSGFPKSLNIGKAVDKLQGNEREDLGWHSAHINRPKTENWEKSATPMKHGKFKIEGVQGGGLQHITKGTSEWEGWGTALKPAHEPICMARKPIEGTVAENCLKWGTGGINIDESRVDTITESDKNNFHQNRKVVKEYKADDTLYELGIKTVSTAESPLGRFPANLIHDNSEEVRECFPETKSKGHFPSNNKNGNSIFNTNNLEQEEQWLEDSGNASRFFKSILYYPKASKSERKLEDGSYSTHPTVKPIALMEYLIKMVTRKGGTVLDPFMGSGTTGVACVNQGFSFVGIEKEAEYIEIAQARIKHAKNALKQVSLFH